MEYWTALLYASLSEGRATLPATSQDPLAYVGHAIAVLDGVYADA